jgi:hypothetical protein
VTYILFLYIKLFLKGKISGWVICLLVINYVLSLDLMLLSFVKCRNWLLICCCIWWFDSIPPCFPTKQGTEISVSFSDSWMTVFLPTPALH